MADIINSVDRSLDMYIYDLYIYIDISLYLSICCVSPTMRCGRLPSRSDVNNNLCVDFFLKMNVKFYHLYLPAFINIDVVFSHHV